MSDPVTRSRDFAPLGVWLLVVLSLGSYRNRSPGELFTAAGIDWEVKLQIACWFVLGLVALITVLRGRVDRASLKGGPLLWFGVWVALGTVSMLYSPVPFFTLFRATQMGVALCLVLAADLDHRLFYRALALYVCINLAFGLPTLLDEIGNAAPGSFPRLGTGFGHPTLIGTAAATGAAGLYARWADRGLSTWGFVGLVLFGFTTVIAINRTSIAALIAAVLVVSVLRRRLAALAATVAVIIVLASLEAYTGSVSTLLARGQSILEIRSLTDRVGTWQEVAARIQTGGLFGEGLGATRWLPATDVAGLGHAHNIYLEALIWLGIPGAILVTLILASWARRQVLLKNWGFGRWSFHLVDAENLAVFVPLAAFCVTDLGFISLANPLLFVFLAAMRLTVDRYRDVSHQMAELQRAEAWRRSSKRRGAWGGEWESDVRRLTIQPAPRPLHTPPQ